MPTREIFGNVDAISKGLFYAFATLALACFAYGVWRSVRRWRIGRPRGNKIDWAATLTRLFTHVFTQRTLSLQRPAANLAHRLLFWGFGVLFIGTVLVAVEHVLAAVLGRAQADPVFHKGLYYLIFEVTLDAFGLAFLAGVAWFTVRRLQSVRSRSRAKLDDSAFQDRKKLHEIGYSIGHRASDWAVLGSLIAIGISGYLIEGMRIIREDTAAPGFSFVGYGCSQLFMICGVDRTVSSSIHIVLWWLHAALALGLIAAFPYCRLLHAIAGVVAVSTTSKKLGTMTPVSIQEVEETGVVGVERIEHFFRRQLLELDACVSCGRCQDVCPAFEAGKPLSPRDVVQDIRAHLDDRSRHREIPGSRDTSHADRTPTHLTTDCNTLSLHGGVITAETLWSCTTCGACVDACPLGVRPLEFITDMRRHLVGEGNLRGAPATALQKMQRSGNPWGLPVEDRLKWAAGLDLPTVKGNPGFDLLYWVGCAAAYDRRTMKVARAVVQLLRAANVNFAVLGPEERCTGESARRMGDEFLFQELAQTNIDTLAKHDVKTIVTHCPHCLNSLINDYPQFGGNYLVKHHSQFLMELVEAGKLQIDTRTRRKITFHDPCYLARVQGVIDPPRQLIQLTGDSDNNASFVREMPRHGTNTACCGAGGGRMWFDDTPRDRVGAARISEVLDTGADIVAVACPFCLTMISDGVAARDGEIQVLDIAEMLVEGLLTTPSGR